MTLHIDPEHKQYLHHRGGSWLDSFREIVFGIEDGLVSTLGVVVGVAAATANVRTVLISGLVVIFVEALSMAAGTYLSNKAENELRSRFLSEEADEIRRYPEKEKQEVVMYLKKLGYAEKEIPLMFKRITSDKKMWLRFMAVNELGFVPDEKPVVPFKDTFYMWISYLIGGSIALSAFVYMPLDIAALWAVVTVTIALFVLGAAKALLIRSSWLMSGLEMMFVGLLAAGIGHLVGWLADKFIL